MVFVVIRTMKDNEEVKTVNKTFTEWPLITGSRKSLVGIVNDVTIITI